MHTFVYAHIGILESTYNINKIGNFTLNVLCISYKISHWKSMLIKRLASQVAKMTSTDVKGTLQFELHSSQFPEGSHIEVVSSTDQG